MVATLTQVLRENGADDSVDIARHVMLPNGVAQATLPIVIGILRDCVRRVDMTTSDEEAVLNVFYLMLSCCCLGV